MREQHNVPPKMQKKHSGPLYRPLLTDRNELPTGLYC